MSKPTLRQGILVRSVQKLLPADEHVQSVVMMSTRHRLFVPYTMLSGVALYLVAVSIGIENPLDQIVLAVSGVAVAGMATTTYTVLAKTTRGLLLCRSSRIRQYAKAIDRRLPDDVELTMTGSTVITSEWNVDGATYLLTKRGEAAMRQLTMAD